MSEEASHAGPVTVLVYSDDRNVRREVRLALGQRVAGDLPPIEVLECATHHAVTRTLDDGGIDLVVADGEATPAGGMGVCRQIKDEHTDCPPVLLLVARIADAWLATWSGADAVEPYPIDPVRLPTAAARLLRARLSREASAP